MQILVDTSVWSLLLRRRNTATLSATEQKTVVELEELIREGRASLLGLIRQELLTGILSAGFFKKLKERLRAFPSLEPTQETYELAAEFSNRCRKKGMATTTVDVLICAFASEFGMAVFSTDPDIARIGKFLSVKLHQPR